MRFGLTTETGPHQFKRLYWTKDGKLAHEIAKHTSMRVVPDEPVAPEGEEQCYPAEDELFGQWSDHGAGKHSLQVFCGPQRSLIYDWNL